ncbi:glycosyltransferase family 4 protein [soil metagenome]
MLPSERRTAYILKMYPRFSETFVVNELLAVEAAGEAVDVFSLRPPNDGRFHESLAKVRADVTYLRSSGLRAADVWAVLGTARGELPGLADCLDELLAVAVVDAVQAVEVAVQLRRRGITHVHAHFGSVATTVARLAARLAEVSYSFTAHAKDIFHEEVDPEDLRRKLADAAAVVTVSDFNLDHLRSTYGAAARGVQRVYNGLDLERFPYADPGWRPPVIAAVGRLVEKKGFGDLLDAVALLVRAGVPVRLDLVGTGPCEAELAEQVQRLGLGDRVRMLGALPQGRVREIVGGAAVFAAPCVVAADGNRDGLPTVLLEAMALGTPCVGTPVTGITEVVRDDDTGLLVPERDPAALAVALRRLLDDGPLRTRLAAAARARVEQDFDVHSQAARLREVFAGTKQPVGAR